MIFTVGIALQYLMQQYNDYKEQKQEREKKEREERLKIEKEMELAKNNNQVEDSSTGAAMPETQPSAGTSSGRSGSTSDSKQNYCGFKKGFLL